MTADDIPCSNLGPLKRPKLPDGRLDRNGSSQCDCSPARSRRKKFVCQIAISSDEGGFLFTIRSYSSSGLLILYM